MVWINFPLHRPNLCIGRTRMMMVSGRNASLRTSSTMKVHPTRFLSSSLAATAAAKRPSFYHSMDLLCCHNSRTRRRPYVFSARSSQERTTPITLSEDGSDSVSQYNQDQNLESRQEGTQQGRFLLQDRLLPCGEHLDPEGTMLPKSHWIRIVGTLPIGSLNQMLHSMKQLLLEEEQKGIIDLDAEWNPFKDGQVPLVTSLEELSLETPLIQAAHVVLSPFGRPTGWRLKLANRSLVYAILARGEQNLLRVGWKVVKMEEYHFSKEREQNEDPAFTHNRGLIVDDTMVRIENCPEGMDANYVRYMFSRYELAHEGNTVLQWRGKTNDGKVAPLMFIVRFASASWARAAIRECQSAFVNGKTIKLVQYPKQIRYTE